MLERERHAATIDMLEKLAAVAGRLEIGFYTSLSTGALCDIVLTLAVQPPDVEINITEGTRAMLMLLLNRSSLNVVLVLGELVYGLCACEPLVGPDHDRVGKLCIVASRPR
jgi:hypothetical protein